MDIVAAQGACTNSNYINQFNCPGTFAPIADYTLLSKAVEAAAALAVLGYTQQDIAVAMKGIDAETLPLEEIVRQSLKKMVK